MNCLAARWPRTAALSSITTTMAADVHRAAITAIDSLVPATQQISSVASGMVAPASSGSS
jgi:hypothetical protein